MERPSDLEQKTLINELNQGRELANQLKDHLDPTISRETCEFLIEKILCSYDKALSALQCNGLVGGPSPISSMLEAPHSLAGSSPKSQESDRDCKDQGHKHVFKKRKTLPHWSHQVRVSHGTGQESPLDDGCSWRKYGQKVILGANFPRAYYRCTHRHVQGCLATKLVQRSDEDPSIFEVTYRGRHTCLQASHAIPPLASLEKGGPKQKKIHYQPHQEEVIRRQCQEILLDCGTGLKTEDLGRNEIFPSFSFLSTPNEPENTEIHFLSEPWMENNLMDSYSPRFISPATSESNFFSLSPHEMDKLGMDHNFRSSESDEMISTPNSVTNSPIGDLDFSLHQVDFDSNFPFDNPEFFS